MQLDFATILVIAAVVTGLILLLDTLVLAPRRARAVAGLNGSGGGAAVSGGGGEEPLPWYIDFSRSFFPVIIAVLILRSFVIEPFRIPSGSMEPTLYPGDFILVNKFSYGLRLPVSNTKIVEFGAPERGDVVVFRFPLEPATAYIKRIVALPGDTIEYRDKQLFVNGAAVPQELQPELSEAIRADVFIETAGDKRYTIRNDRGRHASNWARQVPQDHFFVMGDNRDNSSDSRVWNFLPEANLIGEAFFIWMNWDCITFNGNCNRIGNTIE